MAVGLRPGDDDPVGPHPNLLDMNGAGHIEPTGESSCKLAHASSNRIAGVAIIRGEAPTPLVDETLCLPLGDGAREIVRPDGKELGTGIGAATVREDPGRQPPAHSTPLVEHRDPMAKIGERACGGQARKASANDDYVHSANRRMVDPAHPRGLTEHLVQSALILALYVTALYVTGRRRLGGHEPSAAWMQSPLSSAGNTQATRGVLINVHILSK